MKSILGLNEALILSALAAANEASVADVAEMLDAADTGRSIDDGSIYVALTRLAERAYVTARKGKVVSADGRTREIGFYSVTGAGRKAAAQFFREATAMRRLNPALRTSG